MAGKSHTNLHCVEIAPESLSTNSQARNFILCTYFKFYLTYFVWHKKVSFRPFQSKLTTILTKNSFDLDYNHIFNILTTYGMHLEISLTGLEDCMADLLWMWMYVCQLFDCGHGRGVSRLIRRGSPHITTHHHISLHTPTRQTVVHTVSTGTALWQFSNTCF